jgi:hypothetical protein
MSVAVTPRHAAGSSRQVENAVVPGAGVATILSAALAVVTLIATALTLFVPGVLRGAAVMNGSARGTALVMLVVAVPALLASMVLTVRGSARAPFVWLGSVAYLLYNAVLLVFGTPFNQLFLLYVGTVSLALWSAVAIIHSTDMRAVASAVSARLPARAIAVYIWVIVAGNFMVWMKAIVPDVLNTGPAALLQGTGLSTNPIYVQDLVFWLPALAIGAAWLFKRSPWGYLVAGAGLVYWFIEAIGVATDQWLGHAADPSSPVAAVAGTYLFGTLAVVGLVPLFFFFRQVRRPS